MLREQCRTWMGITSVAVYWPLMYFQQNNTQSLQDAVNTVQAFHQSMEAEGVSLDSSTCTSECICMH